MAKTTRQNIDFDQLKPEQVKDEVQKLFVQASDGTVPAMNALAGFQERRAKRLTSAVKRMEKELGKDHPDVQEIRAAADGLKANRTALATRATRISRLPRVRDHEWMVYGRVVDETGNPVKGLRVRVFDKDRKYDDLLGDTNTDEFGDFHVIYHERDFHEKGEGLPELYVLVSDSKGSLLYSSRDNVRFEAGRAEYFEIQLGKEPASAGGTAKKTSSRTKKTSSSR